MRLLVERKMEVEDVMIYLKIFRLFKSYLILVSDKEQMGIGNVTLSSPPILNGMKSTSITHKLFGTEDDLLSSIIAEKSSYILKAPVLLLLFIKKISLSQNSFKSLANFLNKSLELLKKG